ncbi:testis development-related protein-like [Silurus asotus]|uniref:Testis development-related protein-like n=1 Tax=Silurus asotus TaxID=30991 RepID=A0AAD5A9T4_SILAS|nr:testis development-related protein-like [Silurus asotus]
MNPMWKVYKSKVMKTLNPEGEEEPAEEVCEVAEEMTPVQHDEGPSAVTQLAKRVQGAGTKGWKSVTALFNKDDEHQLLESETESQPVPDHPLAVKPEEPTRPNKRNTGFWDSFATKWNQAAAMKQAEAAEAAAEDESNGMSHVEEDQAGAENTAGEDGGSQGNSFSKYASLGGADDETPAFKWNFVTSKLAELKSKSMTKSN